MSEEKTHHLSAIFCTVVNVVNGWPHKALSSMKRHKTIKIQFFLNPMWLGSSVEETPKKSNFLHTDKSRAEMSLNILFLSAYAALLIYCSTLTLSWSSQPGVQLHWKLLKAYNLMTCWWLLLAACLLIFVGARRWRIFLNLLQVAHWWFSSSLP